MFKKLFSFKPKRDPSELLKLATQKKKEGDLNEAIEYLKKAYKEIGKSDTGHSVKTFLRLPKYLQLADKNDEAWSEFNKLLAKGYPSQPNDLFVIFNDHSTIYDAMKLFLQREKKFKKAILHLCLSFFARVQSLSVKHDIKEINQRNQKEIKKIRNKEYLSELLSKDLKKANIEDKEEDFISLLLEETENQNKIDISRATKRIAKLL